MSPLPTGPRPTRDRAAQRYVVHNVTPNMWEEPWVRHLLRDLPLARYDVRDLWSPPPEHPRRRRYATALESLLPGPARPARRQVLRAVEPEDFTVVVYNTWGLDAAVRAELGKLLSGVGHAGIVSVDEPTRDSREAYEGVGFVLRVGFDAGKYRGLPNLLVAPLGVPRSFVPARAGKDITERTYAWSFLGELKNPGRRAMADRLERVRAPRFLHSTSDWNAPDALRGTGYSGILADSVFVPSPPANVHHECYRTYEALECDAIPLVEGDYYREAFGAPFPVVRPGWADARELVESLLADPESLAGLHAECRRWWEAAKRDYPRRLSALARGGSRAG